MSYYAYMTYIRPVHQGMPRCHCGCESATHIHASLGCRIAPTGVIYHKMPEGKPDRYFKINRLDTCEPHADGHDMTDLELLYSFAAYDESSCPTAMRLPLPRTIKWENFMHPDRIAEGRKAMHKHEPPMEPVVRLLGFPHTCHNFKGGTAVRFGDRVLLAKRINGELQLFEVEVVGTAPAVGIFVVTSDKNLPEIDIQESEPMFAAEVNIVQQRRGDNWVTDAQMEQARLDFEELERRVLNGEHVAPPGLIYRR